MQEVFTSPVVFACAVLVFFVAEVVYVAFGFGAGLIAVGILALIMPELQDVVVLLLLVNLPVELWIVWPARRTIRWRGILLLGVGLVVGIPAGTWALRFGEPAVVLLVLGAFLVLAGSGLAALPVTSGRSWPGWIATPVGALAGVLAGLFGTGGPPVIFYYQLQGVPKVVFRNSLMAVFLVVTAVRLPTYLVAGLITGPRLLAALALVPAVVLGAWVGHRTHVRLEEHTFRRLVGALLALIGLVLLSRPLL